MDDRRGSITVSALVGTGAATLGFALFGLAGLGSDLRAADAVRAKPPVTTQDLSESLREERRSPKWNGRDPLPATTPKPAAASPTPTPSPLPTPTQQEL